MASPAHTFTRPGHEGRLPPEELAAFLARPLLCAMLLTAAFSLTPGLGGLLLALGLWGWLTRRRERPWSARLSLVEGAGTARSLLVVDSTDGSAAAVVAANLAAAAVHLYSASVAP